MSRMACLIFRSPIFEVLIDNSGFVTPFLLTFLEADGQRFWEMESVGILGKLELRESK